MNYNMDVTFVYTACDNMLERLTLHFTVYAEMMSSGHINCTISCPERNWMKPVTVPCISGIILEITNYLATSFPSMSGISMNMQLALIG